MTTTMTAAEFQFTVLLAELEDAGYTPADIYTMYESGDWPSIAMGQEFNTLVECCPDQDLLDKYGIHV